jgi:glycosyltransferase involved in cell wall biosynthesis
MKVAVNAWFLDAPETHTTGSGQYTTQLLSALAAVAPDIQLEPVLPRRRGDWAKLYFEQVEFPRAAQRMNADIALVPYWGPPLVSDVPVVVTIHDVIPLALPAYRGGPRQRAYAGLVRSAAANAAAVITDSEFSKRDIVKHLALPPERVTVVPLAAGARFTPYISADDLARVQTRYQLPERYVLYLGGFDVRKNIETLMQVYVWCGEAIGEEYPLVICGAPSTPVVSDGGERLTLAEMAARLEIGDVVRFIGHVEEEDKPAVYAGARCFLYPSTYEGFGLPPLEAMACGVPVVGSNAASISEVVGNAGMLVDPKDARRMAGALIATCIEDDLHDKLCQRALLRAAQFTWERTALETAAVLRRVYEGRR